MSRRRILLLGCTGVVTAVVLAWYLPRALSPIPGLVAEVKACLEPGGEDADAIKAAPDPSDLIQIEMLFVGFNTTRAETALLGDANAAPRMVGGAVTEQDRLHAALSRLTAANCARDLIAAQVLTSSGCVAHVEYGGSAPVGVAADGSVEFRPFRTIVDATPTLCKDGRIHVQLDVRQSDPVEQAGPPDAAAAEPPNREVKLQCAVVLRDGRTCFVGGHRRKQHVSDEFRVPLLSDLPIVGPSLSFPREAVIDEELLILATVKRVTAPQ